MKDAEFWLHQDNFPDPEDAYAHQEFCAWIEKIQLDAVHHGMTLSAEIAKATTVTTLAEKNAILCAREDILNARNGMSSITAQSST